MMLDFKEGREVSFNVGWLPKVGLKEGVEESMFVRCMGWSEVARD